MSPVTPRPCTRERTQFAENRRGTDRGHEPAEAELAKLVDHTGATLPTIPGIASRAAAEILLETGDVRRFTEAGFARFNGTAPIPASSGGACRLSMTCRTRVARDHARLSAFTAVHPWGFRRTEPVVPSLRATLRCGASKAWSFPKDAP
jgi:transposase